MNRRNFLQLAALAVAGHAAERVWPFRVYSIPKKIVVPEWPSLFEAPFEYTKLAEIVTGEPRSPYPGQLSAHNSSSRCAVLTPEVVRKVEAQWIAALGKGPLCPIPIYPSVDRYSEVEALCKSISKVILEEIPVCNFMP